MDRFKKTTDSYRDTESNSKSLKIDFLVTKDEISSKAFSLTEYFFKKTMIEGFSFFII